MDHKLRLEVLEEKCYQCHKCQLSETRTNVVWGDGDPSTAKILVLGEAPGKDEDEQGIPFIGRSGSLLRKYLNLAEWKKEKYFITNTILCRPPENRKPLPKEIEACSNRFNELIDNMINLSMILCVGSVSANYILGPTKVSMNQGLNGTRQFKNGIILVWVVYHPSYLLRIGQPEEEMGKWLKELENARKRIL